MKILLIEDDTGIGRFVSAGLESEDIALDWVRTAAEGLEAAQGGRYATLVLDLGLPDMDGLELCKKLREAGVETPILMLTARETLADKLDGFAAGADDYLPKPFAFEELLARLNVLLRRGQTLLEESASLGDLRLDLRARRASHRGEPLELSNREFELLAFLVANAGEPVTRQQCLDAVWGVDTELTENTVDVYIGYLRRNLAGKGGDRIQTIRGVGFRLAPPDVPL